VYPNRRLEVNYGARRCGGGGTGVFVTLYSGAQPASSAISSTASRLPIRLATITSILYITMPQSDPEILFLLDLLDEAFDKKSWHGPNLRGSLRGVTARQAAWRVAPERHNIWEYALHAAYWKYVVRRRITGEKRGSFPLPGSNFFARPVELSEAAWKADVALLMAQHQDLRRAIVQLPHNLRQDAKKWRAALHLIRGTAAHDLYHAGQIRLLRRLGGD